MSECSHEKQYCWCEADSWAHRAGELLRAESARLVQERNHWEAYAEHLERLLAGDPGPTCSRPTVAAQKWTTERIDP
jgi:hypothetical protein